MAKKARKKNALKFLIPVYILLVAAIILAIYVVPGVGNLFQSSYIAEYNIYEETYKAEALVVRSEKLYTSDEAGNVKRVAEEGIVNRANSRIAEVGGTGYHSGERGVVCYSYDELESLVNPGSMEVLSSRMIDKAKEDYPLKECESGTASDGSPIFKIVDNQVWYLVAWFDAEAADTFTRGYWVKNRFDENTVIKMKVYSIDDEIKDGKKKVIFSCNRYYDGYLTQRTVQCAIIRSTISGILLETDSIVEEDGVTGVYVANKYGKYNFTPIKVIGGDEETTVAEVYENSYFLDENNEGVYTVKNYDRILRPEKSEKEKASEAENDDESEDFDDSDESDDSKDDGTEAEGSKEKTEE